MTESFKQRHQRGAMPRRRFLKRTLLAIGGSGALVLPAGTASAAGLQITPAQVAGPFYPKDKPRETDWNLLSVDGREAPAGEPLELLGRVSNRKGHPVVGAHMEIWQCDSQGIYDHPRADEQESFDRRFQGYGALETDAGGGFRFLTLMPVPYPSRPPHIHVRIRRGPVEALTTQLYLKDHPENDRDGFLALMMFPGQGELLLDPRDADLGNGIRGKSARYDFVVV